MVLGWQYNQQIFPINPPSFGAAPGYNVLPAFQPLNWMQIPVARIQAPLENYFQQRKPSKPARRSLESDAPEGEHVPGPPHTPNRLANPFWASVITSPNNGMPRTNGFSQGSAIPKPAMNYGYQNDNSYLNDAVMHPAGGFYGGRAKRAIGKKFVPRVNTDSAIGINPENLGLTSNGTAKNKFLGASGQDEVRKLLTFQGFRKY